MIYHYDGVADCLSDLFITPVFGTTVELKFEFGAVNGEGGSLFYYALKF